MKTIIPIILSSDDNYAKYLSVTLVSILANGEKDTFYDVYVLMATNFSDANNQMIQKDANAYSNNKINFIDMKNAFSSLDVKRKRLNVPTFYRLNAAEILPKNYDKCLYFDVDIIVNTDLKELFNTEMGNNIIAGVRDNGTKIDARYWVEKFVNKKWKIPDYKSYVNAGVLILNLKKIREENLTKVFNDEANNNYSFADQDVVNKVCYGRITILPLKYNLMTIFDYRKFWLFYKSFWSKDEIYKAYENPKVIHFCVTWKPWFRPKARLAKYWWKYAAKSVYLQEIIKLNAEKRKTKKKYLKQVSKCLKAINK